MSGPYIFFIALALAMDAFAVAIAAGLTLRYLTFRRVFRLSFHFGFFQFLMPVIGWLAGRSIADHIRAYDHWLAFILLSLIGGKMLWDAILVEEAPERPDDPTRGWLMLTLAIATSIDALAVGLSMAFLRVSVWVPSLIIGLVAGIMTCLGMWLGRRFGDKLGKWAEIAGGGVLLGIGVRILASHLMA